MLAPVGTQVPRRCALTFNRDNALQTVAQVVNRQTPIENGVTLVVFRPQLELDGVSAALSAWATNHGYQWTEHRTTQVSVLGVDFQTVGFSLLVRKGVLPADLTVQRLDRAAASCAAQLFADKVVDLFTGESGDGISDASIVMTIRHGSKSAQTAMALRAAVVEQLKCGRDGMQLRSLHSAPLCKLNGTRCDIERVTREV